MSTSVTTSRRLIFNTLTNIATHVVTAIIGFLMITFFLGRLGQQRYGIWILVASIFQYRMLLSMGLNSAINRYIPVHLANRDDKGISRVVSTAFFFLLLVGIVLAALTVVVYFFVGSWFEISPEHIDSAQQLVLIVGFSFALAIPLQMSSAILSGIQRYDIINGITLALIVSRTVLLYVLLSSGFGLLTMGLIYGGCEVSMRLLQFFFSRKMLPQARVSPARLDFRLLREMVAYGTNTILYTMGALILYKASDILIGIYLDTSQVSRFSVAVAAVFLLTEFTQVFSQAVKPAVSDLDTRAQTGKVKEIAFLTQKYTLLMLIPATCFFVVMGQDFLNVWVGDDIQDASVIKTMSVILAIMASGHAVRLAQHSSFVVLVGRGDHRIFGWLTLVTAVLFIAVAVVCLKVFNLGLVAVAWSNFVPMVLISGFVVPAYFRWKMKITLREAVQNVWLPALAGTAPAVALIVIWKHLTTPETWVHLGAIVFGAALVTLVCSWLLSFSKTEHGRFLRLLKLA